jgi:methyl-accepting chemotaxis protein
MTNSNSDRLDRIDERLNHLVTFSEQLANASEGQRQNIERLVLAFTSQARDLADIKGATAQLLETTRTVVQNSETSNYLAQRNLEATRDLIELMRSRN